MKKIFLIGILLSFYSVDLIAQCSTDPFVIDSIIVCEDSALINITGFAQSAISENFSATGPTDPGWQTTAGAIYTNPYIPSPPFPGSGAANGGTYFWMGATAVLPAALNTVPFNVSFGGQICFDFVYAVQGGGAPTEGPDEYDEGISLQYSPDGGTTWVDIVYYAPNGDVLPSNPMVNAPNVSAGPSDFTTWTSICIPIPAGALGPNTSFQWIQEANSGACCDHWGLDNITIDLADPAYDFYDNGMLIDTNVYAVSPTTSTTYTIIYTNGIDDTCQGDVFIYVEPTVASNDTFVCVGVGDTLSVSGVAPWANVTWTPSAFVDDPNSLTPLATPPLPGPTTTYTVTSACGVDSVDLTFYSVDAVAEKDTICPGENNQLFANVTGISSSCEQDYTVFEIPYYKEFGTTTPLTFSQADNGTSQIIPLPFPFDYYCDPITEVRASTNGYLNMSPANFSLPGNQTIPVNIFPNNFTALMWDDLIDSSGTSNYFIAGTAPNRKFVLNLDLVHVGGTTNTEQVKGQIILHETTNFIDVICENCQNDASDPTATQGIENSTGFSGTPTPGRSNTNWSATNSAYRFMPNTPSANAQTIVWTPSATAFGDSTLAPIVNPDTATTYVVTVTNNWDGCTYTDTVDFIVELTLALDAGPDTSICLGESLTIPATSNGVFFTWTPNDGSIVDNTVLTPTVTPDSTTTYFVEASTGGCFLDDTITVGISNFIVDSTVLVDEICVVNSGSITIFASGQTTGLQYSIDNGVTFQSSNVFNGLNGGTYDIVIGSTNCDTTYSVNIVGGAALMMIDSILIEDANCGGLGSIDIYASGGSAPIQYSINGGTTQSANTFYPGLTGGPYAIQLEDNFACILDTIVFVNATAALDLLVDNTTLASCAGAMDGSVTLTTTGGQAPFQYSIDNINFQSSPTFAPLDTGTYMAYAVDTNGCEDSVSFTINEPAVLDVQIDIPGNVLCAGGTIDSLTTIVTGGTADYTYLWNTTEVTPTIQSIVFGTYWVQVTDTNGCVAVDTVIIQQPVPLYLEISSDSVLCGGQNSGQAYVDTVSGGIGAYNYSWAGPTGIVPGNDTAFNLLAGQYILTVTDFNGCEIMDTTVISEPLPLFITLAPDTLSCFGDNNACIDATIVGGTPPYTYAWSNGLGTMEDVCGLSAGWYSIAVTDARNCVYVDSIEIIQPDSITLTGSQVNVTCNGLDNGSAAVVATGGTTPYTYSWSGTTQVTPNATSLFAGNYTVLVTDANGCTDSLAYVITEPSDSITLTIDTIINVLCNGGNTGSIQVSSFGGTAPYTYAWTNGGGNNEDLTAATANTYTLTITDAQGCPNSITGTITEPTAIAIALAGTNTTCFGASTGSVDATVTGGTAPYTYAWTGPNGLSEVSEDIGSIPAGTYSLTVTDDNNCTSNQNIVITQPAVVDVSFTESPVNCFGGNDGSLTVAVTTGGTAPFTYQWDAAANNQVTATATGLSQGSYNVEISDANGCTYTFNSIVTQPNFALSIALDSVNVSCAGYDNGSANVVASGGTPGYTYLWNDPQAQTTAQAIDLGPGTYQVTVTDANGCTVVDNISLTEPPALTLSAVPDSTNCFGDATGALTITAGGGTQIGYAYSIDGGTTFQNSNSFVNLPGGVYDQIIVQDLGSNELCVSPPISSIVYEQPFFSFVVLPGDTTLQLEESIDLSLDVTSPNYDENDIAQVVWFPTTGLNCTDCIDPTLLTYDGLTEYTATAYYFGDDGELCNYNASITVIVENNLELFIPNAFTPGSFDEVNNEFEVFGEGIEYMTMQIYNRWGEKIFESSNQRVSWDGMHKGTMQAPGVYTFYISVEYLDGKIIDRKGSVSLIR